MTRTNLITAALLAGFVATPALAEGPAQREFTRDGVRYVYTIKTEGDRTILQGRQLNTGSAFRLSVRDRKVSGDVGGVPVSFLIQRAPVLSKQEVAQR